MYRHRCQKFSVTRCARKSGWPDLEALEGKITEEQVERAADYGCRQQTALDSGIERFCTVLWHAFFFSTSRRVFPETENLSIIYLVTS
jgi:hypothetical protein